MTADTWTVIRDVPVITANSFSGAEVNRATWPGRPPPKAARAVAAVPDSPGNDEIAAGEPPGGLLTTWAPPVNGTCRTGVVDPAARPG